MSKINNMNDISALFGLKEVPERHYWLIRTDGGIYYEDFYKNHYVAIGWDFLNCGILNNFTGGAEETQKLKNLISIKQNWSLSEQDVKKLTNNKRNVSKVFNKIKAFTYELGVGDIVVCPSRNSDYMAIGTITSDVYEKTDHQATVLSINPDTEYELCPWHKRRDVSWIKTIQKGTLDIYLQNVIKPQQAIYPIDSFSSIVNRNLYDIYVEKDTLHGIIRTTQESNVSLHSLRSLINYLDDSFTEFNTLTESGIDRDSVSIKLNINSAGILEIITAVVSGAFAFNLILGALGNFINGGKITVKAGKNYEFTSETKGLSGNRLEYKRLELFEKYLDSFSTDQRLEVIRQLGLRVPKIDLSEIAETSNGNSGD